MRTSRVTMTASKEGTAIVTNKIVIIVCSLVLSAIITVIISSIPESKQDPTIFIQETTLDDGTQCVIAILDKNVSITCDWHSDNTGFRNSV